MSKKIELILKKIKEDRFNSSEPREGTTLNDHIWRRFHLNECVKHLHKTKGREERLKFDADEENVSRLKQCVDQALEQIIPPKTPIERVRRRLFRDREARNNRKPLRPQKCTGEKESFILTFKGKRPRFLQKFRRGYQNVARIRVIRELRAMKNSHQNQNYDYARALHVLRKKMRFKHRAI